MVPVSLESRQDCWFSTPGPHLQAAITVGQGCNISSRFGRQNDLLINSHDCWKVQLLEDCEAEGCSSLPAVGGKLPSVFCLVGLSSGRAHNTVTCFLRASKEEGLLVSGTLKPYVINTDMRCAIITHIPLLLIRKQIAGPTHTQRRELHNIMDTRRQVFGATLQPVYPSDAKYPYWIS